MGSKKKVTVGYWYSMGLHMGLCRGPVDAVVRIDVGDKIAWEGNAAGNVEFQINQPNLFGGEKKEGGLVGVLKVLMGAADQPVFPRLAAMLQTPSSAHRGVASVYYDGRVSAMTPYLKPWSFRVRRTNAGWENGAWYPEKAAVRMAGNRIHAMNPAHILWQVYTDTGNGRGLPASRLDETSFRAAADALYAEGFGLCLKFSRQDSVAGFSQSVLDHIGACVYVDRRTGKIVLKLLRDDYAIDAIPAFDSETGLLSVEEFESAASMNGVSEVIVRYVDPLQKGETRSVREKNSAAVIASGGAVHSATREYPGIPTAALAARVALRDLKSLSGHLKKLTLKLDRRGAALNPGDPFVLSAPELGLERMVFRAGRCEYGEGTDGTVTVFAVQDAFGLPSSAWSGEETGDFFPPDITPLPVSLQCPVEAGWRDLILQLGGAEAASLPESAAFAALLAKAPSHLSMGFDLAVRVSGGAFSTGSNDPGTFCPTAALTEAVTVFKPPASPQETLNPSWLPVTVFRFGDVSELSDVEPGTAAQIDGETVRIDAIDLNANTVTVSRGCLDTVPADHPAGAVLWAYDSGQDAGFDPREYAAGMTVGMKALTRTGSGVLALADAPISSLALIGRAARPYPPGNVTVRVTNPENVLNPPDTVEITWARRNRITQADLLVDWKAADIAPEVGATCRIRLYGRVGGAEKLIHEAAGLSGTAYTHQFDPAPLASLGFPPLGALDAIRVTIASERDSLASWQTVEITLRRQGLFFVR